MKQPRVLLLSLAILAFGAVTVFGYQYRVVVKEYLRELSKPELPPEEPAPSQPQQTEVKSSPTTPPETQEATEEPEKTPATPTKQPALPTKASVKPSVNLGVPFTSQAPHKNWVMPYEEACEEASVLMVDAYYKKYDFTPDSADAALLKIVAWEEKTFGDSVHTNAAQTAKILSDYFGYKDVVLSEEVTVEKIKEALSSGRTVIVPTAGRMLGNPHFKSPGPLYHMVVIKGYLEDGTFITNDPGTQYGKNYTYSSSVLMNSIHDYNNGDTEHGKKVMIIL